MSQAAAILQERLFEMIEPRRHLLAAYSGGVDSTLVAVAARKVLGKADAPAAIGDSASLPRHELELARDLARRFDLELHEVNPGEQDDPNYQANRGDRCYFCKTHLYSTLQSLAGELNVTYIANGTNTDDPGDHRPGLQAANEFEVISPLLEAGLNKQDVRALAQSLGLPNADKPASACLASRLAYGTAVTPTRLTQIEQAENTLRRLGFNGFRVRHHESGAATIARIEVPADQLSRLVSDEVRQQVTDELAARGYTYVSVDLAGFRSGSGNVVLDAMND